MKINRLIMVIKKLLFGKMAKLNTSGKGVFVGLHDNKFLFEESELPVAIVGAERSGKGVSFVIPTLLTWEGSAIILDAGGELYAKTKSWRSVTNSMVCQTVFDPTIPFTEEQIERQAAIMIEGLAVGKPPITYYIDYNKLSSLEVKSSIRRLIQKVISSKSGENNKCLLMLDDFSAFMSSASDTNFIKSFYSPNFKMKSVFVFQNIEQMNTYGFDERKMPTILADIKNWAILSYANGEVVRAKTQTFFESKFFLSRSSI